MADSLTALELYRQRAPAAVLREALQAAWRADPDRLVATLGRSFGTAFIAADFPVSHLPVRFTVWRGGRGDVDSQAKGVAWTTARELACRHALSGPGDLPPVVLSRHIRRADVLAQLVDGGDDVLVLRRPGPYRVDGTLEDWAEASARYRLMRSVEPARATA